MVTQISKLRKSTPIFWRKSKILTENQAKYTDVSNDTVFGSVGTFVQNEAPKIIIFKRRASDHFKA